MAETICWIQHIKNNRRGKNSDNDRKALYKLRNNPVYGKTMESLRNRNGVRLVSNKNDCLKWTCKPSYMPHKIFDNYLVVIRKTKFH